jgi:hypothetical protein
MDSERLVELLEKVRQRKVDVAQAVRRLRHLPFEDLGFAKVDHHRALRQGFPEVNLGEGKEPREIAANVRALRRQRMNVLVTRVSADKMARLSSVGFLGTKTAWRQYVGGTTHQITGKGTCCRLRRHFRHSLLKKHMTDRDGQSVEKLFDVGVGGINDYWKNFPGWTLPRLISPVWKEHCRSSRAPSISHDRRSTAG